MRAPSHSPLLEAKLLRMLNGPSQETPKFVLVFQYLEYGDHSPYSFFN